MADWESLASQLKALGVQVGKDKALKPRRETKYPIEQVLEGDFHNTVFGDVFYHEEYYPHEYLHGNRPLHPVHPIEHLCQWANADGLSLADLRNIIFLDTETSGLAGGTGTYAFEVGLGRFTENGFHLSQFFMRHPGEEPALLMGINSFVKGIQAVVTYNGKSFDIPLLNTRFALAGISSPFVAIDHFDLLPLARRLWRNRLGSRTLGNVESQILGVTRSEQEVPGYLIPDMYFDYLKTGDARPIADIFYHNAIDILSLTGLFSHMAFLLHKPHSDQIIHPEDIAALARFFESIGDITQAKSLYDQALRDTLPESLYWDTLYRHSFLLKRNNHWEAALALWEKAAKAGKLYAFEELAKYYEHHAKDLQNAKDSTERALSLLKQEYVPPFQYQVWKTSLEHRLARIERKIASN